MKIQYKNIYRCTWDLFIAPTECWCKIANERTSTKKVVHNYFLPVICLCSILFFPISLTNKTILQALGLTVVYFISSLSGTWIAYIIIREYMCNKLDCRPAKILILTIYSATIFLIFHNLGNAFGTLFIGQLLTLLSFIFIRTLYAGIEFMFDLPANQKTNVLIIASLSIICFPIIISKLLMIAFQISAINV